MKYDPSPDEPDMEDKDLAGLADYEIGFQTRLDGKARDKHQTEAWLRGWDAAHRN